MKILMGVLFLVNGWNLMRVLRIDRDMRKLKIIIPGLSHLSKGISAFGMAWCVFVILLK